MSYYEKQAQKIAPNIKAGLASEDALAPPEVARRIRERAPSTQVLITLGAAGVWLDGRRGAELIPAPAVQAVDTVGAGDTFVGAFAAQLAEGAEPVAAARLAWTRT